MPGSRPRRGGGLLEHIRFANLTLNRPIPLASQTLSIGAGMRQPAKAGWMDDFSIHNSHQVPKNAQFIMRVWWYSKHTPNGDSPKPKLISFTKFHSSYLVAIQYQNSTKPHIKETQKHRQTRKPNKKTPKTNPHTMRGGDKRARGDLNPRSPD